MTRRGLFALPALLCATILVLSFNCRRSGAAPRDPSEEEAERYFVSYLQIDSSNPPGAETAAAKYLQTLLTSAGIQAELVGSDPARQSVYARLSSGTTAPALLLLHHLDVVPADGRNWTVPPFSGRKQGGYIWGRGALDIKSLGVAQLMAMLELKRSNLPLARDVIFMATPDEELGGSKGVAELLQSRPDLFRNVGFVLTEGGGNETVVDKVTYWGIETQQKVPLWVRINVRGASGHAAIPPENGGSAAELIRILGEVLARPHQERVTPDVQVAFRSLSVSKKGEKAEVLADVERFVGTPRMSVLSPGYRALLRDTVAITRLEAGTSINTIPADSSATLDIRLLPDETADAELQALHTIVGKRGEVEVLLQSSPVPASSTDTDLFRTLVKAMKKAEPGSEAGLAVSAGTSDGRYFRARGVVVYGISPFKVNYYDVDSVHGRDERIRAAFFHDGVRLTKQIVVEFCGRAGQ